MLVRCGYFRFRSAATTSPKSDLLHSLGKRLTFVATFPMIVDPASAMLMTPSVGGDDSNGAGGADGMGLTVEVDARVKEAIEHAIAAAACRKAATVVLESADLWRDLADEESEEAERLLTDFVRRPGRRSRPRSSAG